MRASSGCVHRPHPLARQPFAHCYNVVLNTHSTCRVRAAVAWIAAFVVCCSIGVVPLQAQFRSLSAAERVQVGQRANLFAEWESRASVDGMLVELPTGWTLVKATALHNGYQQLALSVTPYPRQPHAYLISSNEKLQGRNELILQVETGGASGLVSWSITPFVREVRQGRERLVLRTGYRTTANTRQVFPRLASDNRVLAFRGEGPPLLVRSAALPDLSTSASYTVEFWLRTTDVEEVIISTWAGDERRAYPLEFMVDASGRLAYYRGRPGQHQSMRGQQPVADGQWHHIALIHDGERGWTRLLQDGQAADSLYDPVASRITAPVSVAVGGRIPQAEAAGGAAVQYTGLLDELRFWPVARTGAQVRQTMRQTMSPGKTNPVVLSFDASLSSRLVASASPRAEQVPSDLMFYHPVRNLHATPSTGGVLLKWETQDGNTERFIVERSSDGRTFEPVGSVKVDEQSPSGRVASFSFQDLETPGQVVFYRVRQRFVGGTERLTGAIKLGLGQEPEAAVVLVDSFPNPFSTSTTIRYQVRKPQRIRVSVWDLSGQLVATLVNRVQEPGFYQARFNASDLPSGSYFVRLQTPHGTQSRQVILMK